MSAHVTLYTQPGCGPCIGMKSALERAHIAFEVVDVTTDQAGHDRLTALGYTGTPVVEAGELHWHGVDPAKVAELAARLQLAERLTSSAVAS